MVANEVYRYTDKRGDTIIFKFDPDLITNPGPDPDDGPLTVFHIWKHQTRTTTQWSSHLMNCETVAERWRVDKKPMVGLLLWQGELEGRVARARFVGWEKSERGWVVEMAKKEG